MRENDLKLKISGFSKSVSFLFQIVMLWGLPLVLAQPGFLSVACGAKKNYTDKNNITWFADANYINVGRIDGIPNASTLPFERQSVRFFPQPLQKSCYQLPVTANKTYILRLSFFHGNHTKIRSTRSFYVSLEDRGAFFAILVNLTSASVNTEHNELIFTSSSNVIYICLTRGEEVGDPFISAIELRQLSQGMYDRVKQGTLLFMNRRVDLGAESSTRYPLDRYDRIWSPYNIPKRNQSTIASISENKTNNFPPSAVMRTALVANSNKSLGITITNKVNTGDNERSLILLYFAEIERLNSSVSRIFDIFVNGKNISSRVNVLERTHGVYDTSIEIGKEVRDFNSFKLQLVKTDDSTLDPIINALEHYVVYDAEPGTLAEDVEALSRIKTAFGLTDWISDPCYLVPWNGTHCTDIDYNNPVPVPLRVLEINLSGWNLNGSIPPAIGQLTTLKYLSLDHNNLRGSLPDLSNLTQLKRLHLQNNNLSGRIPEWLSRLNKLKELYNGNPLLKIPSSSSDRRRLVLGLTLGSILATIVAFTLLLVYLKRRRKKTEVTREAQGSSTGIAKGYQKSLEGEDYSMVMVPNTTKSRTFTLDEMMTATHNFTQTIGKGGFGTVYYGKLSDGKEVAVKVLSMYSSQGVQEFLNEVDLLSRVHHKNLVTLLGYCNESRELMLIYEHMSGGSLRDHLYGSNADPITLWESRLQIALDAAQGLEYLQVKCTPKIIHRDVKTANILLDKDLTGKLADFGLSRTTMDAGATHITTTVKGTAGYIDPEYFSTHMLTEKSDVYSFGVVLLEIGCGRKPIDVELPEEQRNLIRWVTPYLENEDPNRLVEIIDKHLTSNCDIKSVFIIAKLAIRCVQPDPASRPNISQVVAEIKDAMELIPHPDEVDIEYGDLPGSLMYTSTESSYVKEKETTDNTSNTPQEET